MKKKSLKLIFNKDTLLTLILVIYFCGTPISAALTIFLDRDIATLIVSIVLFFCILIYCITSKIKGSLIVVKNPLCLNDYNKKYNTVFLIYTLIAIIIFLTIMIHPEYMAWYSHDIYGIKAQFLSFKSGIWALLIITLYKDENKLLHDLKIVTTLVFLLYFGKFIVATYRGYWVQTSLSGGVTLEEYNMEFGFRMLFAVAFWGAQAILNNKKKYLLLYIFGLLLILAGGSRAPALWALATLFLIIPFKYKSFTKNQKNIVKISFCIGLLFLINANKVLIFIGSILKSFGLTSRTVESLAQGNFLYMNGRDVIYSMAIELIKNGSFWGYGFYGDRYYIGEYFRWGYAHNIFLELLIMFGSVIGTLVIVLLVSRIIKLYKISTSTTRKIIVITFLTTSLRLLLSGSFWYEAPFWALIALSFTWCRSDYRV